MLLVDSFLLLSQFVQTSPLAKEKVISQVSGILARLVVAKVEEDRKVMDDFPTLVAAARTGKVEDVEELVMAHQTLKSVSSVVRVIIGRVIVQRWMISSSPKNRKLGDYAFGAWTCNSPDHSREKCLSDSFQMDPLFGAAVSPGQDDDECEAHAAFLVESEGFGGGVEGAEALCSRSREIDT